MSDWFGRHAMKSLVIFCIRPRANGHGRCYQNISLRLFRQTLGALFIHVDIVSIVSAI